MAQRASPRAFRLGYNQDWDVYYFAKNERENIELVKKVKAIKDHFYSRWRRNIARLKINLTSHLLTLKLYVSDTGVILGENNQSSEKVLQDLYQTIQDDQIKVNLELVKIKNVYANAQLVSNMIADQLEKRASSRKILDSFVRKIFLEGPEIKGIWIRIKGRLDGAEMARIKKVSREQMPLNTKDIRIEEGKEVAVINKGTIGIHVSIYKGKIYPNSRL